MAILTTRATHEFAEDLNNDGVVGIPDFNQFRGQFGQRSEDLGGELPNPSISSVSPLFGAEGDQIFISGQGFDPNPMNTCVFVGGLGARARVISASSDGLVAQIGKVCQPQIGDVVVVTGRGILLPNDTHTFADATFTTMSAVSFTGRVAVNAHVAFQLTQPSPNTDWAVVTNEGLSVTLTGNWRDGETITVDLHLSGNYPGGWMEVPKTIGLATIPPGGVAGPAACASDLAADINAEYGGMGVVATASGATITVRKAGATGGFGSISHGP